MKCSTEEIKEMRGFQFFVNNCDKDDLYKRISDIKSLSDSSGKTYILRLAESNYFRFELLFIPNTVTLISVATARGTNNINLRDFESLDDLISLSCCVSTNEQLREASKNFLNERTNEAEIVDLFSQKEEFEVNTDCSKVKWNEIKFPETVEGKWNTTELATVGKLSLKALAGQIKFLAISTERPQNSIKFTNFERFSSLCCFLNLVKKKLDECPAIVEAIKPFLTQEKKRRSRKQ
ncbi:hypothetical protein DDW13_08130 [Acidianus hospitalis]|jgi:hypothetical protein|uniref:Uncharacterized protein n=2 Tax=Acidianus hospitalis TaxID=563177 RepID=A0A2T9X2D9_9CREN|nr:hypothetical protein [Acidianus hospitalis]AEE93058.1 conserved hypothetical protein [Acidianus hospitalis W1]PVU74239.1 hypothetical protein DDW13_08130 [Acidianus hospitalis]